MRVRACRKGSGMDILYIAFTDFSKQHYGPCQKVLSECRALERLGHTVTLMGRERNATVEAGMDGTCRTLATHRALTVGRVQNVLDKHCQIRDILHATSRERYDACYIRFDLASPEFLRLLRGLKRVCERIDIEIPTYPYAQEYAGRLNRLRLAVDAACGKRLPEYVDRIISFYGIPGGRYQGIPVLQVPNGFDFDALDVMTDDTVPEEITIAAVSTMRRWHGYERMIEGLRAYYGAGGARSIVLHLVGEGREEPLYRALVERYGLQEHVLFHGPMHGAALHELMARCTLGLDSLARHRTGISVLSSLKSREYGAMGIPIINSCDIDVIGPDFPYLLKVPPDETPVDMNAVIAFHDRCYAGGSRTAVARSIRTYMEGKCGMDSVMSMIYGEVRDRHGAKYR